MAGAPESIATMRFLKPAEQYGPARVGLAALQGPLLFGD
jgi:hypothetical protein